MPTPESRPDQAANVVRLAIAGDPSAAEAAVAIASSSDDPALLVIAAVSTGRRCYLDQAGGNARTTRDRQLIALADAHLRGADALFDVLVREHLAEYPDHVLAAWLAAEHC